MVSLLALKNCLSSGNTRTILSLSFYSSRASPATASKPMKIWKLMQRKNTLKAESRTKHPKIVQFLYTPPFFRSWLDVCKGTGSCYIPRRVTALIYTINQHSYTLTSTHRTIADTHFLCYAKNPEYQKTTEKGCWDTASEMILLTGYMAIGISRTCGNQQK